MLLENPLGVNTRANPTEAPATPSGVLAQGVLTNNTAGGVNPNSIMAAYLVCDIDIGGDSFYDGRSLTLMGHLFIGCAVTYKSNPPTSDDVDFWAPYFYSDDLFFSNEFQDKLEADAFYDAVETLHNTGALATDTEGKNSSDESPPANHPGNQYFDSSDSEDEPEPPYHVAPVNLYQFGLYGWLVH